MHPVPGRSDPLQPAFASPPHITSPTKIVACWYTDPPGVIMQMTAPTIATTALTDWVAGPGKLSLLRKFAGQGKLTVVLDMRLVLGRDPAARHALVEPAKAMKAQLERVVLVPPLQASRVYVSSLYAATALLSVFGYKVDIEQSLAEVIRKHALREAAR